MKSVLTRSGVAAAVFICLCYARPALASEPPASVELAKTTAQPEYANFLPPLEIVTLPAEQSVLDAFLTKARGSANSPTVVLRAADDALANLPSPTKLRGMIQYARAQALEALNRDLDAFEAAEESAQLLPGYSGPLIKAFTLSAYLNRTAPATEYLIRAINIDPTTSRTIDDYEIGNLLHRLQGLHDEARERAVSDRLLQIGWVGNHIGSRSHLAAEAIKLHLASGDIAGARTMVSKLLTPGASRDLLMMNAYAPIWPDIEAWAGPQLERQWPIYLDEARERWTAGRTVIAARDYLSALMEAEQYEVAIRDILPIFNTLAPNDDELIFMVPQLARSLAHLGRWSDADALYVRTQQTWPIGLRANALNISANHALLLLKEGHLREALALMDSSLADARHWGPEVGVTALVAMQHSRSCILHELGRDAEARISMMEALAVERGSAAASLHLCMGAPKAAKTALLDALKNELTREDVVRFMQPPSEAAIPSPYDQAQRAGEDALRADPELRLATSLYGRILPWRLNQAAGAKQQ